MPIDLFESVLECGCAAKVPAGELAELLRGLDLPTSDAVIVGPSTLDDAGVYRLSPTHDLVQTVDFFPPVARSPEDFGRIAAANALSDLYAMGATPLTALAIACLPSSLLRAGALAGMLRGAAAVLREAGCMLLGGHSVLDPQVKLGFAVTGLARPGELFTNAGVQPGDALLLTKPLGTGATLMAVRAGLASAEQERAANEVMATLNARAAGLARQAGVRAATDITGFGLLGHALQVARASGVALELDADAAPLLDGALGFAELGLLSAATYTNRSYVGDAVVFDDAVPLALRDLCFDPQTSGGLLLACPAARVRELATWAAAELSTPSAVIGRAVAPSSGPLLRVRRGGGAP